MMQFGIQLAIHSLDSINRAIAEPFHLSLMFVQRSCFSHMSWKRAQTHFFSFQLNIEGQSESYKE
jgi:hypothetical protein